MAATQSGLRFLLVLIVGVGMMQPEVWAKTARRKAKAPDRGQAAIVVVDGAAIYEKANFDSPVMDYLERDKKILISNKIYRGAGGLGAFYKIRVRKGVFGYITDVDVQVDKRGKDDTQEKGDEQDENDPTKIRADLENPDPEDPSLQGDGVFFTRYLGLNFNQFGYKETIAKKALSSDTTFIGMKLSGPGKAMGGMPLDYELSFTTSAPDFYSKYFSSSKGFLILTHAMTILPLVQFKDSMLYYGFGLVGRYSKFDVSIRNKPGTPPVDSQDLAVGIGGHVGYAMAFGRKYSFRIDGKYYYEKEAYFGYGAALQMKF